LQPSVQSFFGVSCFSSPVPPPNSEEPDLLTDPFPLAATIEIFESRIELIFGVLSPSTANISNREPGFQLNCSIEISKCAIEMGLVELNGRSIAIS